MSILEYNAEYIKKLSLGLFAEIKPTCVELSLLSLNYNKGNDDKLVSLLARLIRQLDQYYMDNKSQDFPFIISKNLADYIFFPLSNLLKQSELKVEIIINVVKIIDYLIVHCWKYQEELGLIDQLFPLVLFLSNKYKDKSFAVCLLSLINLVPQDYFKGKRMLFLGDSITLLLSCLSIPSCTSDEDIQYVSLCLSTLSHLYSKMSPDDLSQVLPGTISSVVNFTSNVPLIHYTIILQLIDLLTLIITKVFRDDDLKIHFELEKKSLEQYSEKWQTLLDGDADSDAESINTVDNLIKIDLNNSVRTKSWLVATSSQLKLSLIVFFKNLLINHKNRLKVQSKSQIGDEIVKFIHKTCSSCFGSLFEDFFPLAIDILALYISIIDDNDEDKIAELAPIFTLTFDDSEQLVTKQTLIFKLISSKLPDLIENRLPQVLESANDDKINTGLVSIKFQMKILHDLSNILQLDNSNLLSLEVKLLQIMQKNLQLNLDKPSSVKSTKKSVIDNNESTNKLDDIELPPYVNANLVKKISQPQQATVAGQATFNTSLVKFSTQLQRGINESEELPLYLTNSHSSFIEGKFSEIISFISTSINKENDSNRLAILESILSEGSLNQTATGLWIANIYLKTQDSFKIDDFLDFDEVDTSSLTEGSYLTLARSLELIDQVHTQIQETQEFGKDQLSAEFAYSVALDAIGNVCSTLSLEDFRADFMIEYLLPLLEALTLISNPKIQNHAMGAIRKIVDTYYQGSLESLLVENLDYLIDSINLKLSSSDLTPTLPGILLVIIRFAGIKLLLSNQLIDIVNQIFITIDTFHGYSKMVEGYFIVFDELTRQISSEYKVLSIEGNPVSPFRPWGMTNIDQLCTLLQDNDKMINFEEYDREAEYFKEDESLADSDDEDEMNVEEDPNPPTTEEVWTSIVPQTTYNLALTIFNYGFKLLSQQETSLKVQILKTLIDTYPILCTDYKIVGVQVTNNYPILITLISGTLSLSTSQVHSFETENLIAPALELATKIIEEDDAPDRKSFSRQFTDTWSFLSNYSPIFRKPTKGIPTMNKTQLIKQDTSLIKLSNPKLGQLYSRYIASGINCYNKTIPDLVKIEMVRFCVQQGLPDDIEYCQEIKNIVWVLKYHSI